MLREADLTIDRVVFTSDLLKVDDRRSDRFPNPQGVNVAWLEALFGPVLRELLPGVPQKRLVGDESQYQSLRWHAYSALSLPLESSSWAHLYEGLGPEESVVSSLLEPLFGADLAITFEAPPYLVNHFVRESIPFVDFAIHPVRFLPDYLLAVRSNVAEWQARLAKLALPDATVSDFARVSAARTSRVLQGQLPEPESALFLGQIEVDSSLISNRRLAQLEDVQAALIDLCMVHPHVYYKAHPHLSNRDATKRMVEGVQRCSWIEINVYDALACPRFATVASLSSGSLIEAEYFGRTCRWFLGPPKLFRRFGVDASGGYHGVYEAPFSREFWRYLVRGDGLPEKLCSTPNAGSGALRFTLNMKWGR